MITHTISPYLAKQVPRSYPGKEKIDGKVGSQTHKRQIFNRCKKKNPWKEGDFVVFDKRPAQVLNVAASFDDDELIKWEDLKCLYIEIYIYPDEMFLVHHNDLRAVHK